MKKEFKAAVLVAVLLLALPVWAAGSYKSTLKRWTRHGDAYVWNNLEARVIWHATYLSPDFRKARAEKMAELYEWTDVEKARQLRTDEREMSKYDEFFVSIYSGSSQWSDVGQNEGNWKIVLESGGETIPFSRLERTRVTEVEREFFPYLDKWSNAYLLRFPKTLEGNEKFKVRMTGIPARSELVWK